MPLSKRAQAALAHAGYGEGRRVDTGAFERALAANAFEPTPAVRLVLQQFGGVHVSLPHPRHAGVTIAFHFDAARAASSVYRERVDALAARAGQPLCPVGEALGGVLLMDASGAVYAALDDWLVKLGVTALDAIDELCAGGSGIAIE